MGLQQVMEELWQEALRQLTGKTVISASLKGWHVYCNRLAQRGMERYGVTLTDIAAVVAQGKDIAPGIRERRYSGKEMLRITYLKASETKQLIITRVWKCSAKKRGKRRT